MKTAVRFLPWAATQSARSCAWPTVRSGSTRTASSWPEMSVAAIGCHRNCCAPGGGSSLAVGSSAVTYTSQVSGAGWVVIGAPFMSARELQALAAEIVRVLEEEGAEV